MVGELGLGALGWGLGKGIGYWGVAFGLESGLLGGGLVPRHRDSILGQLKVPLPFVPGSYARKGHCSIG